MYKAAGSSCAIALGKACGIFKSGINVRQPVQRYSTILGNSNGNMHTGSMLPYLKIDVMDQKFYAKKVDRVIVDYKILVGMGNNCINDFNKAIEGYIAKGYEPCNLGTLIKILDQYDKNSYHAFYVCQPMVKYKD